MPPTQATELVRGSLDRAADRDADAAIELRAGGPAFRPEFVRRPALVRRLREAASAAIALIVAPPGYGKTSLLSDWAQDDERPFIWLGPGWPERPDGDLAALWDRITSGHERGGCVVVVEDAHLIAPNLLRSLVCMAASELPSESSLVLASRAEPDLPLGRFRAHRAVIEIGTKDLAMTTREAMALLRLAGAVLEVEAVEELVTRTEGWPAALYLAALSEREDFAAPDGIVGFRGDDHLLSEYLRDDVLLALPEELRTFVIRTSVLNRLSASACDWVLRERASALTLATVARKTQLLRPLDAPHHAYRWHPLFLDTLRGELSRREPALERRLHRRASRWYADHRDTEHAIDHACRARDAERVGELLWPSIVKYLTNGRYDQVRSWIDAFTDERIGECSELALCRALTCLAAADTGQAEWWAMSAMAASDRRADGIATGLLVIEAAAARDGLGAMRDAAERAHDLAPGTSPWRPVCLLLRGVATHLSGDRAGASRLLESAIELGGEALPSATAVGLAQRAMIAMEERDWDLAVELTEVAARMIRDAGLDHEPTAALVFATCAATRAHQGRADEAKRDLRRGIVCLTQLGDGITWHGAEVCLVLAHASLWLADIVGARTLLAQASRLARRTTDAVIFEQWFAEAWSYMDTVAETKLSGPSALTIAELRVLRFLPSHRSFREIASQLGVSANTVKTQAHAVYRKLGAASRSEAIARAQETGLLGQ